MSSRGSSPLTRTTTHTGSRIRELKQPGESRATWPRSVHQEKSRSQWRARSSLTSGRRATALEQTCLMRYRRRWSSCWTRPLCAHRATVVRLSGPKICNRRECRSTYKWLVDNSFPSGFNTLCANCNTGKYLNGGMCPGKSHVGRINTASNYIVEAMNGVPMNYVEKSHLVRAEDL